MPALHAAFLLVSLFPGQNLPAQEPPSTRALAWASPSSTAPWNDEVFTDVVAGAITPSPAAATVPWLPGAAMTSDNGFLRSRTRLHGPRRGILHSLTLRRRRSPRRGDNGFGECDVPDVGGLAFAQIAAGGRHSLARMSDGTIRGWGTTTPGCSTSPTSRAERPAATRREPGTTSRAERRHAARLGHRRVRAPIPPLPPGLTRTWTSSPATSTRWRFDPTARSSRGRNDEGACDVPVIPRPRRRPTRRGQGLQLRPSERRDDPRLGLDASRVADRARTAADVRYVAISGGYATSRLGGATEASSAEPPQSLGRVQRAATPGRTSFVQLGARSKEVLPRLSDGSILPGLRRQRAGPPGGDDVRGREGGKLNESQFGLRMRGVGPRWGAIHDLSTLPTLPPGLSYLQAVGGTDFSAALRSDGSIVVFGTCAGGICDVPDLPRGVRYVEVDAEQDDTIARRSDGTAVSWGYHHPAAEVQVPAGTRCVQVSAGFYTDAARLDDGTIIEVPDSGRVPPLPPGLVYTSVSAGGTHSSRSGATARSLRGREPVRRVRRPGAAAGVRVRPDLGGGVHDRRDPPSDVRARPFCFGDADGRACPCGNLGSGQAARTRRGAVAPGSRAAASRPLAGHPRLVSAGELLPRRPRSCRATWSSLPTRSATDWDASAAV
jgi:hypothetical protein